MSVNLIVNGVLLSDVELCIFDKDGTIIDVHTYWANMVRFRADFIGDHLGLDAEIRKGIMEAMGVDTSAMCIKPEGPVGLKKREIVLRAGVDYLISIGHPDYTGLFDTISKEVDAYSLNKFDEIIKPLPGAHDLLSALKYEGCRVALATTDIRERASRAMEHLDMLRFVDEIAGADGVVRPKPDPEIIFTICERLGVPPGRTVMIGDAEADVQTGLNANCLGSIGVKSGLTSRQRLEALTPLVIPDISHIAVQKRG
jgi:HAD superfamily hydrolase (TIGR01549 family)